MLSRRTQLFLSLVALALSAALAAVLVVRVRAAATTALRPVPVRPIAPGERLRAADFRMAPFPAAAVRDAVADPAALEGRMARTLLRPGAPVAPEMVGDPDDGLPPGWGSLALRLPAEAALGGRLPEGLPVHLLVMPRGGEPRWLGPLAVLGAEGQGEVVVRLGGPAEAVREAAEAAARARIGEVVLHLVRLPGEAPRAGP